MNDPLTEFKKRVRKLGNTIATEANHSKNKEIVAYSETFLKGFYASLEIANSKHKSK